ncbi:MAG TPA: hypothetical protein PLV33_10630 [Opitutaceae bacterium]|nr:hypothetical protein [Opitutaceae bacterium]HOR25842.1 hypothetical protein [Opitutaceae bacterium]HPK50116.1 hypothetical protein [Opitutaceae bacterium]
MLFSSPAKSFFIEENEHTRLIARTSAGCAPLIVEEIREVPKADLDGFANILKSLQPKRAASGYIHATCSVFPQNRVIRRVTLEAKRLKEANYLSEVCSQQLRVEPDKHALSVLLPSDGTDFDVAAAGTKDVLFCGMPSDDVVETQDAFLSQGVYPESLEIGSVALLGALVDYVQLTKCKAPTLVLEIGQTVTQSHILSPSGVDASRSIPQGIAAMVPVVQKELGLKDEESAKKLFYSNTFDFGGMGPLLVKRLIKELQSSIGFYEVQTGQSIGQVVCFLLPAKLGWLENAIANSLGVGIMKLDVAEWARYRRITFSDQVSSAIDPRWFSLFSVMARYNIADSDHAITAEEKQ